MRGGADRRDQEYPVKISNTKNALTANSAKRDGEFIGGRDAVRYYKAVFSAYKPHRAHGRADGHFPMRGA